MELSFGGICLSIDYVSVFLKVDHVHLCCIGFLFFWQGVKVIIKAFPVSASKLVDLSALFILVLDFYVEICDNDVVVGYPWYRVSA